MPDIFTNLYHSALGFSGQFTNFPLGGVGTGNWQGVYSEFMQKTGLADYRPFKKTFFETMRENHPGLRRHSGSYKQCYQLGWSKPLYKYDGIENNITLQFAFFCDEDEYYRITLPKDAVHTMLMHECDKTLRMSGLIRKYGRQLVQDGQTDSLVRECHSANLLNCEKFSRLTGMGFDFCSRLDLYPDLDTRQLIMAENKKYYRQPGAKMN